MTSTTSPPSTPSALGARLRTLTPVLALVAWTLFVWVGRVRNIVDDEALTGWSRIWRLGFALSFVVLGTVAGVLALGRLVAGTRAWRSRGLWLVAVSLAAYGALTWLVRGIDIALGNHSVGFKVVHVVLAVVSIGLGAWVLGWARSTGWTAPERGR
jgi:hypothetical protein